MNISKDWLLVGVVILAIAAFLLMRRMNNPSASYVAESVPAPSQSLAPSNPTPQPPPPAPQAKLPAAPAAGAPVAAPAKVVDRTAQCASEKPSPFLAINIDVRRQMQMRQATATFKPLTQDCFVTGQEVMFNQWSDRTPDKIERGPEGFTYRGRGKIEKIFADGSLTVRISDSILGRPTLLAPRCPGKVCDETVRSIPKDIKGLKPRVIAFLREGQDYPKVAGVTYYRIPREGGARAVVREMHKRGEIAKQAIVFMDDGPYVFNLPSFGAASEMKNLGATYVAWYWGGVRTLLGLPVTAPLAKGAKSISAIEAAVLLREKKAAAFHVVQRGVRVEESIPGSTPIVINGLAYRPMTQKSTLGSDKDLLTRWGLNLAIFPKDRSAPVILYGSGEADWRPTLIAEQLLSAGYKNVSMIKFGDVEYREAKNLGLIK